VNSIRDSGVGRGARLPAGPAGRIGVRADTVGPPLVVGDHAGPVFSAHLIKSLGCRSRVGFRWHYQRRSGPRLHRPRRDALCLASAGQYRPRRHILTKAKVPLISDASPSLRINVHRLLGLASITNQHVRLRCGPRCHRSSVAGRKIDRMMQVACGRIGDETSRIAALRSGRCRRPG